jgi:hypothetical protein
VSIRKLTDALLNKSKSSSHENDEKSATSGSPGFLCLFEIRAKRRSDCGRHYRPLRYYSKAFKERKTGLTKAAEITG